jgi:hypothetical protein
MKAIIFKTLFLFISVALFSCSISEKRQIKQGDELIVKIEEFKAEKGYLPDSLEDIGIKETLEGPLFYEKKDSIHYMVWFGTSLGESMIYYSDTKEWDYRLRGMGKKK